MSAVDMSTSDKVDFAGEGEGREKVLPHITRVDSRDVEESTEAVEACTPSPAFALPRVKTPPLEDMNQKNNKNKRKPSIQRFI